MSEIYLYNTLSKKKEKFIPINKNIVKMYVCGPTLYSNVHIGNIRTFMSFDMIYRYFNYIGYNVRYVKNITDVGHLVDDLDSGEDKILLQAKKLNLEPMEIVQMYKLDYYETLRNYNINHPNIEPLATGHIPEQIELIEKIISNGFAYESNGSVYFDVDKYSKSYNYGILSGRKIDELISTTRELDGQDEKRNLLDFALWKKADEKHLMKWKSPWSDGFPGWHLECSAMGTKYLGEVFDIHGGGMDLKFPHHECEIAQNIAANEKNHANYWLHANMLTVNGQKMSKSLGNSFTTEELKNGNHPLFTKGFDEMTVKFFMLQCHYSSTLDFSSQALEASEKAFIRIKKSLNVLNNIKTSDISSFDFDKIKKSYYDAMNDDFNSPILIANIFNTIKLINQISDNTHTISQDDKIKMIKLHNDFIINVLGLKLEDQKSENLENNDDELMKIIVNLRNIAKNDKNYILADIIRDKLNALNIKLIDTNEGVKWEKID